MTASAARHAGDGEPLQIPEVARLVQQALDHRQSAVLAHIAAGELGRPAHETTPAVFIACWLCENGYELRQVEL